MHILIADDHPLFREALRHVIERVSPRASYVEVASHRELEMLTREDGRFDLMFVDLAMPGGDAFAELMRLRERVPLTPAIVVSSREDPAAIRRALECGVAGYIPKSVSTAALENAIRAVLSGDVYVPEHADGSATLEARPVGDLEPLTPRQHAVLEALARGRSNREIASDLGIEEITVKVHISAILRKLRVKNRVQAVVVSRTYLGGP